tara:strand:+ start:1096 stop:2517 length:1422 start_codon:yes stop_codon:yes gene_type:complete
MSKVENANSALVSEDVSDAEAASFDLGPHLIKLMWDEPFFSEVLRIMKKTSTQSIPTAGVYIRGSEMNLVYNPKFMAGLSNPEIKGLLKHECYHLVFEHTTTRRHDPHIIWNYATDLAINSLIAENELPKGGLIPGKAFEPLTAEQIERMGKPAADRYQMISQKIASFPREKNSEWYFARLMEDDEVKDAIESSEKMGGKSLSEALADGTVKIDENGDLVDQDGNQVTLVPGNSGEGSMDNHDGWDDMSDEDRDAMKGAVKKAVEAGVRKCDSRGRAGWGSIGAEMQATLRKMISNEIPWQSVLKQFVGMTRRADRSSNIRRLNRKYPGIHPGSQRNYRASIAVYVDQSGSVSDNDLELLAGELEHLAGRAEFTLFNFDTSVDEQSERTIRKGSTVTLERTRCGGTDFQCVQDHANANIKKFDGYLVLTDGWAPATTGHNKLKRGWVIVPEGSLQFTKSNRDFLIQMTGKHAS